MNRLIIVLECNKLYESDHLYVADALTLFDYKKHQIRYVFLHGKCNYNKTTVLSKIHKELEGNLNSKVIYILDTDQNNIDSSKLNNKIEEFCKTNSYELIWMNLNIESVFLHKKIEKNKKQEAAKRFVTKDGITKYQHIDLNCLYPLNKNNASNFVIIIKKYMKLKH